MDKIAIISDIHGNITALEAVLEDIKKRNINKIFCLGDNITKCTHPDLVIDKIKENKLSTVFYIEFSARKIADTISSETGAEPLLFHSCHTVSGKDFENGITYIDLMKNNLENLKRGLNIEADWM